MARDIERANRQCCDVDIRDYATKAGWLFADFCNITGLNFSSDNTYAKKKGQKAITFPNPMETTIKMECQVHPFKIFAMLSDGVIETSGLVPEKKTITADTDGEIAIAVTGTNVVKTNSVFVYPHGEIGTSEAIAGTFAGGKFTATTTSDIAVDEKYDVIYIVEKKDGIKKVSFNDKKAPRDFFITMRTNDKDDNGEWLPMKIVIYKASPKKTLNLEWNSEGDVATLSIELDCLVDMDGNVVDMIEDDEE